MSGGFSVNTGELSTHAATVDALAGDVGTAASAAATERMGGRVYGVLFDAYALPFLNQWADSLHGYLSNDAGLGHSIAAGLKGNVANYTAVEQSNTKTVGASGGN